MLCVYAHSFYFLLILYCTTSLQNVYNIIIRAAYND